MHTHGRTLRILTEASGKGKAVLFHCFVGKIPFCALRKCCALFVSLPTFSTVVSTCGSEKRVFFLLALSYGMVMSCSLDTGNQTQYSANTISALNLSHPSSPTDLLLDSVWISVWALTNGIASSVTVVMGPHYNFLL